MQCKMKDRVNYLSQIASKIMAMDRDGSRTVGMSVLLNAESALEVRSAAGHTTRSGLPAFRLDGSDILGCPMLLVVHNLYYNY
jgi:hypothetical protein